MDLSYDILMITTGSYDLVRLRRLVVQRPVGSSPNKSRAVWSGP